MEKDTAPSPEGIDLFSVRHDLASVTTALHALRSTDPYITKDAERARRIFDMSVTRLHEVLDRLDKHLIPYDPRILK